jgi:hypothetical protein
MSELWYEQKNIQNAEGYQMPAVISEATTLRDQFAMAALTGLLSLKSLRCMSCEDRATFAYLNADAMLKAREAK